MSVDSRRYWEDRLAHHYSLGGVGYLGLGDAYNKWMYRIRRHVFRNEIRECVDEPSTLRVLDIGSGTGFYVELWHELDVATVTGSDLTDVAVDNLRQRYPRDNFVQFDVGGPRPFAGERFDAVSMMDVLFHIVDDAAFRRAIANVFELLEDGGLLLVSDNFVRDEAIRIPHQASRTAVEIESAVLDAGFEILRRRPVFYLMNAPVDSESRLHQRWWNILQRALRRGDAVGRTVGALLYPVELALVSVLREGPSTEMMVCRRPVGGERRTPCG